MSFQNIDTDASWGYYREPYKNKLVMGSAILSSVLWSILFGIFRFQNDINCSDTDLATFSTIAFWLFITCAIVESVIIISILVNYNASIDSKFWGIFNCILLLADIGISLFIYIRGIILVFYAEPVDGCESLYYLLLVYVIIVSVLIGLFLLTLVAICCCAICCTFLNK